MVFFFFPGGGGLSISAGQRGLKSTLTSAKAQDESALYCKAHRSSLTLEYTELSKSKLA